MTPTAPSDTPRRRPRFFYGWVIVGLVALAQFTQTAEIFPVLSVLLKPITEEFGWSRTTFTLATSIGTLFGGFAGPFVGRYVDRVGGRSILLVSFSLLGASMIGMAFITELWQFFAIQIVARFLALGVITLAVQIMIPKWFIRRRARAVAISSLGGRLGNSITPIYVAFLVVTYNWRVATVTTGFVMLALTLLPIALFMRRQPEDMGLLPDGVTAEEQARLDAEAETSGRPAIQEVSFTLSQVARMRPFWILLAAQIFGTVVGPALNLHLIPYLTDRGFSEAVAVASTTTLFLMSAPGSLVFGFLSERFGVKRTLTANYVLTGVGFLLLLMVQSPTTAIAWAAFQGLIQGGGQVLNQTIWPDYFGRGSLGSIRGAINPLRLAANAAGPLAAAVAYDATGSYLAIFALFGLFRVISGILVLLAQPPAGSAAEQSEHHPAASAR